MNKKIISIAITNALLGAASTSVLADDFIGAVVATNSPYELMVLDQGKTNLSKIITSTFSSGINSSALSMEQKNTDQQTPDSAIFEPIPLADQNSAVEKSIAENHPDFRVKIEDLSGDVSVEKKVPISFDQDVTVSKSVEVPQKKLNSANLSILDRQLNLNGDDVSSPNKSVSKKTQVDSIMPEEPFFVKRLLAPDAVRAFKDDPKTISKIKDHIKKAKSISSISVLKIDKENFSKIKSYVNGGGIVKIEGLSHSATESLRIKWANVRANQMLKMLIDNGISASSIKVVKATGYKKSNDEAGVFLTLIPSKQG